MKLSCTHEQSDKLRSIKNFPPADMIMQYYWAANDHPVHMKDDKDLIKEYDGVDKIPCWSIAKMMDALPSEIFDCEDEVELTGTNYILHILPGHTLSEIKYIEELGTKILYETSGVELRDALFEMIMKHDDIGWYNPIED